MVLSTSDRFGPVAGLGTSSAPEPVIDPELASVERGPADATPAPELWVPDVDLLIPRPDLGAGCHTLIHAGTPIPADIEALWRKQWDDP